MVAFQVSVTRDNASGLHVRCGVLRLPQTPGSLLGKLSSPVLPAENEVCVPEMTVCRAFVGEQKHIGSRSSARTVRNLGSSHQGLLILHNAFNST